MVIEGRSMLEVLTPRECRRLLRSRRVGRVGVVVDGRPEIFPVNYGMLGHDVVFRTAKGTKLDAAHRWTSVAFEVDSGEDHSRPWSVLVVGVAQELDGEDLRAARSLPFEPWASGEKGHWLRIVPAKTTGRRLRT